MKDFYRNNSGTFLVMLAGICWGLISIFIRKLTEDGFDSFQIMCFRSILAAAFLGIWFLFKNQKLFKIDIKDIWMFLGTGLFSLTFFSYCYFTTIVECGAAIGVVLLYTSPIFVMLMSAVFFREKITVKKIIALLLTFAGCILVAGFIGSGTMLSPKSFIIGLGAGFGYALYSIFAGFAVKKYSSLTVTFYTMLISGLSILPFCRPMEIMQNMHMTNIAYIIGVSLICTAIPYIAYTAGLSKMEAGKAAVLVTVEPLVGSMLGIFAWGEEAGISKIIGIILIFSSVVLLSIPMGDKADNSSTDDEKNFSSN